MDIWPPEGLLPTFCPHCGSYPCQMQYVECDIRAGNVFWEYWDKEGVLVVDPDIQSWPWMDPNFWPWNSAEGKTPWKPKMPLRGARMPQEIKGDTGALGGRFPPSLTPTS